MSQMKEALNAVYAPEAESAPTREMMFDWINNNTPACSRSWSKNDIRQWYADNCPFWNEDWWWETKHPNDRPVWKQDLPYIFWSVPQPQPDHSLDWTPENGDRVLIRGGYNCHDQKGTVIRPYIGNSRMISDDKRWVVRLDSGNSVFLHPKYMRKL